MVQGYGKGIKYALLIANSLIFVCGVMLLAMGIWTISDRSMTERLLGISVYLASAIILIITGTIVSLIAFVGALGAQQEIQCLLKTYFVILLALAVIISTVGGIGFAFRDQLDNRLQKELQESMRHYGNDSKISDAWDSLQINFHCCGISYPRSSRGADSWRRESVKFNNTDGPLVPESCCRSLEDDPIRKACQSRQPRKDDTWTEGCYEKIKTTFKNHSLAIGLSAILAVLFIIFGLFLSGSLFLIIRQQHSKPIKLDDEIVIEE